MTKRSWLLTVLLGVLLFNFQLTSTAQEDTPETLAGKFVDMLAKEDFASVVKWFDATMTNAMPEATLKQTWASVTEQAGKFKKQVKTRVEKVQGYDAVFVTCEFEKVNLDVQAVFDSQKRVAGLFIVPAK
ncbi:MAG: DUF3887 domain-containing protein [Deltaproteobacteria bacterium]|nr:DUF3887 domain-containing protein [Deltaproteobacteria bacterium]